MNHPFFENKRLFWFYLVTWGIVIIAHVAYLILGEGKSLSLSVIESVVFNLLFAILGLAMWYPLRFISPERNKPISLITNLLTYGILVVFIWIVSGDFLMYVFTENEQVAAELEKTMPWRAVIGFFFFNIIILFYYLITYYNDLQKKIIHESRLRETIRETELNLLKSQINPHFLFNSLNSVSALTLTKPEKAHEMIVKLSDFLRYGVSNNAEALSPLREELENVRRYLDIETVRFGKRLRYEITCNSECQEQMLPSLILQPLFENAVKHGVYDSTEPVKIMLDCQKKDSWLEIVIQNSFDSEMPPRKGSGTGLNNVSERLKLMYGSENLMKAIKSESLFTVTLIIPYKPIVKS
jgi:two-component system, LytTR family, sensor kinase